MASRHGNRYQISINDVNLNEPQGIALEGFQDESNWTNFNHSNQHQGEQLDFDNSYITVVPNRQMPTGVVPSMQLMNNTVSFPESSMNLTSHGRDGEEETMNLKLKRIMKNRESAARSRARKMAYTNELENKVKCLEEELKTLQQQKEKEAVEHLPLKQEKKGPPPRRANSASF
ncbi:hypothetical protein LUZ63_013419 [Rhynchospora breviuscula]|uniref:BZIP domain-containing protein n=1 Tax=Rhynchospora breviuscula TaxID=2022672 RepID=A0A9Q0HKJ9_9POAL|nr:hypothetical protein LUZ63_013419 [Rhynchospora breviuscula]